MITNPYIENPINVSELRGIIKGLAEIFGLTYLKATLTRLMSMMVGRQLPTGVCIRTPIPINDEAELNSMEQELVSIGQ